MQIAGMDLKQSVLDDMDKLFSGKSLADVIKCNLDHMAAEFEKVINAEVDRRAQEKFDKMLSETHVQTKNMIPDGYRKVTVVYDPHGNETSIDFVRINVEPENDEEAVADSVALLLAAAKRFAQACPSVDERVLGQDFLGYLNDYMTGLVMSRILGGMIDGECS